MMGTTYTPTGGSPATPVHKVSLTNAYLLGETEVTYAQYARFLTDIGATSASPTLPAALLDALTTLVPSYPTTAVAFWNGGSINKDAQNIWTAPTYPNYPVNYMTWYGAMAYAVWAGGRLPTEAEWEYAARDTARGNFLNGSSNGAGMAATKALGGYAALSTTTVPVKTKNASNWGLYDIYGNVWEWCFDRFLANNEPYPSNQPVINPEGINPAGTYSVVRGGGYNVAESKLSIGASRLSYAVNTQESPVGFRVAFPLK
jgi:formylglycine-generating enzyme required for sulfatase activity